MHSETVFRIVPVQITQTATGILLMRGCLEMEIAGTGAVAAITLIVEHCSGRGESKERLLQHFSPKVKPEAERLIDYLQKRRILIQTEVSAPLIEEETALDLFYWNFATDSKSVISLVRQQQLTIVGVNGISRQIVVSLLATGIDNFIIVDDPRLRNRNFYGDDSLTASAWSRELPHPCAIDTWMQEESTSRCILATSDFGVAPALSFWNNYCVKHKIDYLPVVLDRLVGTVGPHTTPGETACYQCFRMREDAVRDQPELHRQAEATAHLRQLVDGAHPSMSSMLGDIAALEVLKFYGQLAPPRIRNLVEVKMIPMEMRCRWVLRAPHCPVCGRLEQRSASNIDVYPFFGENPLRKEAFPEEARRVAS